MKVQKNKQRRELLVLGSVMHNTNLLHSLAIWNRQYDDNMFIGDAPQKITEWCLDYYTKHGEAPGADMLRVKYVEPFGDKTGGGALFEQIESVRRGATSAWNGTSFRRDQLFDIAEDVFRRQQVLIASDRMGGSSSAAVITEILPGAIPVTLTREPEYDSLFDDPNIARDVLSISKPIFTFEDEILNTFFDDSFARSTFTALIAPEKRGKSQWLLEFCMRALFCKKNVLYIDAGDMTGEQIFLRFLARACNRPYKPGNRFVWNDFMVSNGEIVLDVDEEEYDDYIGQKRSNKVKKMLAKAASGRFFSRNFPRGMLTVATTRSILDSLSIRGINIDVLIIDYADILGASKSKYSDNRHAVTEIWGDLRTLSQTYDLALITATQANASSYTEELSEKSFSESKTKRAFITAEIGIDKTEIHESVFKLHYTFRRTGTKRGIYVASDLATYQPAVKSCWVPKVTEEKSRKPRFSKGN